jgi:GT2 family glycosyltransferase
VRGLYRGDRRAWPGRRAQHRLARGAIIAFTDDDCIPDPGWLSAGASAFAPGVAGVDGTIVVPLPDRPTDYERDAAGLTGAEFATANCFYRREVLAAVGGFDERFTAAWREDSDLFFTLRERGYQLERARCGRRPPGAAGGVGRQPAPAAQKHVQRAAV